MIRVLLAGEGRNELGGWADEPPYRDAVPSPGVVEAILRRVRADGWEVVGAVVWRSLRKYRVGEHGEVEVRNIRALKLKARERGAHVVAFVRDRDGSEPRQRQVERAIGEPEPQLSVIGGMAIEKLESWLLSLRGMHDAEQEKHPEKKLPRGIRAKDTAGYVQVVAKADLDRIPADARSLLAWVEKARDALAHRTRT
jgi:DNA-binding PadR family transcriptional regulator